MYTIDIQQNIACSVDEIFSQMADHQAFGRIVNADIKCTKPVDGEYPNGLGSVRLIRQFPNIRFEETITAFEPNKLIEYKVTRGSPIKNHRGSLVFTQQSGHTHLHYVIHFEPKLALPLWGKLLKFLIERPIRRGLASFADNYK